jgi:hypothetical protein
MAGSLLSETVAFSVEFSRLSIAIPQVRLTRYRRILFCAQYPEAYDSMDVTLTNPIIANSLRPPEDRAYAYPTNFGREGCCCGYELQKDAQQQPR